MSEHQYYEFLAVDRPLDERDRQALRELSTRARITTTRFVNTYDWGDFSGDPALLMERWFDIHLYWANWGTRRLMLRLPKRCVDPPGLEPFLDAADGVTIRIAGDNVILDIVSEDEGDGWTDGCDGEQLAAFASLRADLIDGDLRLFYLLWLRAVEAGALKDDAVEPLPALGPLTASLRAFADFVRLDPDLVRAAAESEVADMAGPSARSVEEAVADLPGAEKDAFLVRLFNTDPCAGAELKRAVRRHRQPGAVAYLSPPRTVAALRARADEFRLDRLRATAEALAAHRRQQAAEAARQQRTRLDALDRRGDAAWTDIETEIARRTASGYAKAADLLAGLKALAAERRRAAEFDERLAALRKRHATKGRFIERLAAEGL